MEAAINAAMDEATDTSIGEPMIDHVRYIKRYMVLVFNATGGARNAVYFQFSNTLENRKLDD